jgi:hypothetical protein
MAGRRPRLVRSSMGRLLFSGYNRIPNGSDHLSHRCNVHFCSLVAEVAASHIVEPWRDQLHSQW